MDNFYTDSSYEINIISKGSYVKDISGNTFTSSDLLMESKVAIKTLDKDSKLN